MNKDHMERTQIYLPVHLKQQMSIFAHEDDTNFSAAVRTAIEDYTQKRLRNTKKRKEAFLKALDAAFGIWKDRDDIVFDEIRGRSNRTFKNWNK